MKKILCILFLVASTAYADDYVNVKNRQVNQAQTKPDNYALTVTSYGVTTEISMSSATYRRFYNNGSGTIWRKYKNSTNIVTTGQPMFAGDEWVNDEYLGAVYFQSESMSNNLRVEKVYK